MARLFGSSQRRQPALPAEAVQSLLEAVAQPALVIDADGRVVAANAAAAAALGLRGGDDALAGRLLAGDGGPPWRDGDGAVLAEALAAALAGGEHHVTVALAPNGTVPVPIELTLRHWDGLGGGLDGTDAAIVTAVPAGTAAHQPVTAPDAAPSGPELLRTILDAVPVMIAWYGPQGRIRLLNRAFEQATGWTIEAARGIDIMEACYPDPVYRAVVWEFMMNPDGSWRDLMVTTRDGGILESAWTNVRLSDGSQIGLGFDIAERRTRQRALERANAELTGIIDGSQDLIAALDTDFRHLTFNGAYAEEFERIFGRTPTVGADLRDLLDHLPEERDKGVALWARALGGERFRLDHAFGDPNRRRRTYDLTFNPIRDADGHVSGAVHIVRDVTERRAAEEEVRRLNAELEDRVAERTCELAAANAALRESERRSRRQLQELETLYRTAPIGLGLLDRELRFRRLNQMLADFNGLSIEDHLGRLAWEVVPDLQASAEPLFRRVFETGEPIFGIELHGETPKEPGVARDWVEVFYPLMGSDGSVASVGIIAEEVTGQKRAERALREGRERLEAALAAAGAGTFRWDIRTDTVVWDDSMARLFGLPEGEAVRSAADFLARVHPEDRERVAAGVEQCSRDGSDVRLEFRVVRPDGEVHWLLDRAKVYCDEEGRPVYVTGACVDITDRMEAEEQLNLLVAELDHRVKNTLAMIQSMAAHTRNHDGSVGGFLQAFRGRLHAMAHAHGLLSRSRWAGAALTELVGRVLEPYAGATVAVAGPQLTVKPKAALALSMALHELATNAVKYGALSVTDGRVDVHWQREGSGSGAPLVLTWRETGGPPPTRVPDRRGFGSELIERSLRYELGGEAELSFGPDGLVCRIVVPADELASPGPAEPSAESRPETPETPAPSGPKRILVAEDSLLIAMEVMDTVEDLGWTPVGPAGSVQEALDLAEREAVDGALLDVNLGDRYVYPVAEWLAARGVPFVFVTGFEASRVLPEAWRGRPCLQKPFDPVVLQRLMATTFADAGAGGAAAGAEVAPPPAGAPGPAA
jgi:PAS domain S-box-containing protein